jgi:hemolysin D
MATTGRSNLKQDVQAERERKRQIARDEIRRKDPRLSKTLIEFQPDAVEIEQRSVPGGARWTLYTVFALIAAVCIWAAWAEVDRIVVAPGKFVVDKAIMIQPGTSAPIREIHAKFGQIVRANDLLATLDPTFSDADVNQIKAKLNSLQAAHDRLTAELEEQEFSLVGKERDPAWLTQLKTYLERKNELQSRNNEFASEQAKLEVQTENNAITIDMQKEYLAALEDIEKTFRKLAEKGNASPIDYEDKRLQVAKARAELKTAQGKTLEIAAEKKALSDRQEAFMANWRSEIAKEIADTYAQISENEQMLNKAMRAQQLVEIRVPTDLPYKEFYVLEVADRTVGSVAQTGEALFKLVPTDALVEVEIKLPDRDIGQVKVGQEVRLKLSALPYQRHGYLTGIVRTISEDSVEREDTPGVPRQITFIARVELTEATALENKPDSFRLRPGMLADTEIVVGKRRVYEYFLYPLIRSLDSSIREP